MKNTITKILPFLFLFMCLQRVNATIPPMNNIESRISVLLDTLDNPEYWQSIPSNFMGKAPDFIFTPPYRIKLIEYKSELDELITHKDSLSNEFLIRILDYKNEPKLNLYMVIMYLTDRNTKQVENVLYDFFNQNIYSLYNVDIAKYFVNENSVYADSVKQLLLADNAYNDILFKYLRVFDKETDAKILELTAEYVKSNLKDNPFESYLTVGVFEYYFDIEIHQRDIGRYVGNLGSGDRFERARNQFWRDSAKDVLRYYERNKKSIFN